MKYSILIKIIFLILFSTGCTRVTVEKNDLPQGYSVAQIIGKWKITSEVSDIAYDVNNDGTVETNIHEARSNCEKDNLYEFYDKALGKFRLSCDNSKTGTWQLEDIIIVIRASGLPTGYEKIDSLTSDQIISTSLLRLPNNEIANITKTWTRQ